jgi:DNA invertase Pin-like site-specific DNA recombinase
MKTILYLRVSRREQLEGESLTRQHTAVAKDAQPEGIEVVEECRDEAEIRSEPVRFSFEP